MKVLPRRTRLERVLYFFARTMAHAANFSRYFRIGRSYGYPICCTAQFSWELGNPRYRGRGMAVERGAIHLSENPDDCYVPCSLHMKRHPNWRSYREDDNIRQLRIFTMEPKR